MKKISDDINYLLWLIYAFGGGAMLRQQALYIAVNIIGMNISLAENTVSKLIKSASLRTIRLFFGCPAKMCFLSSKSIRQTGSSRKVPDHSPSNMLYAAFRTELIISLLARGMSIHESNPLLVYKNSAIDLFLFFKAILPLRTHFKTDYDIERGIEKRIGNPRQPFLDFSFRSMLQNNFLYQGHREENGRYIFDIIFLDVKRISPSSFYSKAVGLMFMLSDYFDIRIETINFHMYFFSKDEQEAFERKWKRGKFDDKILTRPALIRNSLIDAHKLHYYSLDFDKKYGLHRDL